MSKFIKVDMKMNIHYLRVKTTKVVPTEEEHYAACRDKKQFFLKRTFEDGFETALPNTPKNSPIRTAKVDTIDTMCGGRLAKRRRILEQKDRVVDFKPFTNLEELCRFYQND